MPKRMQTSISGQAVPYPRISTARKTTRELTVKQHFAAMLALLEDEPEPTVQQHFNVLKKMLDDWRQRRWRKQGRERLRADAV